MSASDRQQNGSEQGAGLSAEEAQRLFEGLAEIRRRIDQMIEDSLRRQIKLEVLQELTDR
jgi:hypothetical protein